MQKCLTFFNLFCKTQQLVVLGLIKVYVYFFASHVWLSYVTISTALETQQSCCRQATCRRCRKLWKYYRVAIDSCKEATDNSCRLWLWKPQYIKKHTSWALALSYGLVNVRWHKTKCSCILHTIEQDEKAKGHTSVITTWPPYCSSWPPMHPWEEWFLLMGCMCFQCMISSVWLLRSLCQIAMVGSRTAG